MKTARLTATPILVGLSLAVFGQGALPSKIEGHWTWREQNKRQVFSLTEIKATSEQTASASLTWWTANTRCAIRDLPIQLRTTDSTIAFDATTKCDVSFTAELSKTAEGWQGKAVTKQGPVVSIEAQ